MIGKIKKGASFAGLQDYMAKDGHEVIALDNLASTIPEDAAREMEVAASVSRRTQKPVLHLMASYDPADPEPTNQQMHEDAREILAGLGLTDHQAVIVRHNDTDHPHMHIMVNRVGPDGKTASDSQSYARVEASLRQIEARRGLTPNLGRHAPDPATGKRMEGHRNSRDPRQHEAPPAVRTALAEAQSWPDLKQRLADTGWKIETTQKRGQKAGAILIGPQGQKIAAGRIDRNATMSRLHDRFGTSPKARAARKAEQRAKTGSLDAQRKAKNAAGREASKSLHGLGRALGAGGLGRSLSGGGLMKQLNPHSRGRGGPGFGF